MSNDIVLLYAKNCEEKGRHETAKLLRELVAKNPNPPYLYVYKIIKDVFLLETPDRDLRPDIREYAKKLAYAAQLWEKGKEVSKVEAALSEADVISIAHDWMLLGRKTVKTYASTLESLANSPEPVYRDSWNDLLRKMLLHRDKEIERIAFEKIQT